MLAYVEGKVDYYFESILIHKKQSRSYIYNYTHFDHMQYYLPVSMFYSSDHLIKDIVNGLRNCYIHAESNVP